MPRSKAGVYSGPKTTGGRFTNYLKLNIFLSSIQFVWNLRKSLAIYIADGNGHMYCRNYHLLVSLVLKINEVSD